MLRLMETFTIAVVTHAVEDALHLIQLRRLEAVPRCRIEWKAAMPGYAELSYLPLVRRRTTQAVDYMSLLAAEVGA